MNQRSRPFFDLCPRSLRMKQEAQVSDTGTINGPLVLFTFDAILFTEGKQYQMQNF